MELEERLKQEGQQIGGRRSAPGMRIGHTRETNFSRALIGQESLNEGPATLMGFQMMHKNNPGRENEGDSLEQSNDQRH